MSSSTTAQSRLVDGYLRAKFEVIEAGYAGEIMWQSGRDAGGVTAREFVREAAWVVLSAGMSEAVVATRFPLLARAFQDFDLDGLTDDDSTRALAMAAFGHARKIDAIFQIAHFASDAGNAGIQSLLQVDRIEELMQLPYIGPATSRHLLKNLGVQVAKPDRHLLRIADRAGVGVEELCETLAHAVEDSVAVVDLVLWRWSTMHTPCRLAACAGLPH